MICTGDNCKARQGPRPALFHHSCYIKYCNTILNAGLHDEEECTYCMDCRCPNTIPLPLVAGQDMTEDAASSAKRVRGGRKKK